MPVEANSHAILSRLLARASLRGERALAVVRLVLCAAFLLEWLLFPDTLSPDSSLPKYDIGIAAFVLGILYSSATLFLLKEHHPLRFIFGVSVTVDAILAASVVWPIAYWVSPGSPGLLRQPLPAVLLLVVIGAGFRLLPRVAIWGAVLSFAVLAGGLGLEATFHLDRFGFRLEPVMTLSLFLFGAALFAWSMSARTRKLVFEGAEATLSAERARQRLGVYVSEEIAEQALGSEALTVGGKRQALAVLFSDLRGFTPYAEQMEPEQLVRELNAYLDVMVRAIRQEGGIVDKFMGDAIMVVFGILAPGPTDAARAIRTAVAMDKALAEHNRERAAAGRPPFRHGIGVHAGEAIAGNIGNENRLQFTVVGDVVNTASRLEEATKEMDVSILISHQAIELASSDGGSVLPKLEPLGRMRLPGQAQEIEVFTPLAGAG